jgi:hypothetical protein
VTVASGISRELHPQRDAFRVLTNCQPRLLTADVVSPALPTTLLSASIKVGAQGCMMIAASVGLTNLAPLGSACNFRLRRVANGGPSIVVAGAAFNTPPASATRGCVAFNVAVPGLPAGVHDVFLEWSQPAEPGSSTIFVVGDPDHAHASLVVFELPTR